mgnify:CR=1 FL=1
MYFEDIQLGMTVNIAPVVMHKEKMLTFVIAKIGKHAFFEAVIGMPMEIKNDFSDRFLPSKKATD